MLAGEEFGCLFETFGRTAFRLETLAVHDVDEEGLPDHDFRLFDNRDVYRMHYTPVGKFVGGGLLPADRLAEYQDYRDVAITHAVPFASSWERYH